MKKFTGIVLIFLALTLPAPGGEITSLSQLFVLGKGLQDRDLDDLADSFDLSIIIPDISTPEEIALAADIAARANLESLAVDFSLVLKESQVKNTAALRNAILIGNRLHVIRQQGLGEQDPLPSLTKHQGVVQIFSNGQRSGITLLAGSQQALLKTGRAFFLRWPYLWDILGRDSGATYFKVEKDIKDFFNKAGIDGIQFAITRALYEFPDFQTPHESLKRLKFNNGEIKELTISVSFSNTDDLENALNAVEQLIRQHHKGKNTYMLTYPGCANIILELQSQDKSSNITIRRVGTPKRMLTPSYKSVSKLKIPENPFDLQTVFTPKGIYSDTDKDGITDSLKTYVILSRSTASLQCVDLTSRLVLHTTGASFPIVRIMDSIKNPDKLISPILIGQGHLTKTLIKTGKLKVPPLENGWGMVKTVPKAFNKSTALAVLGADQEGLEKTLAYISRTFPFFNHIQDGAPEITSITASLKDFFDGKNGMAEAFFKLEMDKLIESLKEKDIEYMKVYVHTSKKNAAFSDWLADTLQASLKIRSSQVKTASIRDSKTIFHKNEEFPWEGDDVINLISDRMSTLKKAKSPLNISIGVSESPAVRQKLSDKIRDHLLENGIKKFDIEVLSSYKQGFFWLIERVLPALRGRGIRRIEIRFAEEKNDFFKAKRFYTEAHRWFQELYPVDEIFAEKLGIPLDKIEFEIKSDPNPTYELKAFNENNNLVFSDSFTPATRETYYLNILPEWGTIKLTTGWLRIKSGTETVMEMTVPSDLEIFWDYFQDEILPPVYAHVLKTTGGKPTFDKQPYFKRLQVELWFSEPDYKLGLDEEIISSLESIHDEIYFDTLDFLRGITHVELKDSDSKEDTSRYSAPGNILPLIHPSTEGKKGRVKVLFEDWQARIPQILIRWKEYGREEQSKKIILPKIETREMSVPCLVYNGNLKRVENLYVDIGFEKESEYLRLIDILSSYRELQVQNLVPSFFNVPKLKNVTLQLKHKDLEKEETIPVFWNGAPDEKTAPYTDKYNTPIVSTTEIISPENCLKLVQDLSSFDSIHSYTAGQSFEGRPVPVLEIFRPMKKYVSLPRLITFKPTLYLSGRQHANEVSSTNYILKFAEHLATRKEVREYLKKMNFILHPMENPDGAALAYSLQKITPFHSLHAGRYTALGIDVGYQVNASKPILPEAKVRKKLYEKWLPDIYLNLHGYPSHEWVQQFSNYSPYLFRDYWIPRGWFAYYKSLSLPIYKAQVKEGLELRAHIVKEMNSKTKIKGSNKKLYDRYFRWAVRWQPHMNYLELYDGLNLYAKRRSSRESILTNRRKLTFVEETPELMDETAHGEWLDFLCEQGLTYIMAHVKYLSQVNYPIERIEEESQDRIHIRFVRGRPGDSSRPHKNP